MKRTFLLLALFSLSFGLGYAFKTITGENTGKSNHRVKGIGGIFFKCRNPEKMTEWYQKHLGLNTNPYGASFEWFLEPDSSKKAQTQWTPFPETTTYFEPSGNDYMINYIVGDLEALVAELKRDSVTIVDNIETYDFGKFVHILDAEGNKIQLWEPVE